MKEKKMIYRENKMRNFTLNEPVDATLALAVDAKEPRLG
jgi:hypothetical protein